MKIICIGRNYRAHAEELHHSTDLAAEGAEPVWFLKPDTAMLRNNDPFYIPHFTQEVHYECELIVRINRVGRAIAERFAHRYYDEVGLGIDFTARDLQREAAAELLRRGERRPLRLEGIDQRVALEDRADAVLRELAFITALPASAVLAAQGSAAPEGEAAKASVLVQGIADIVLVFPDHLELLDYKTDRRQTEADFLAAYRAQLNLYALAIDKRFAPKKVTYKGIYSLELGKLIEVKG